MEKANTIKYIVLSICSTLFFLFLLISPQISLAHPGDVDSYGGHTCYTNCSSWGYSQGEYHFHTVNSCVYPVHTGCKTESDLGALRVQQVRNGTQRYTSAMSSGALAACEQEIIQYNSSMDQYNSCLSLQDNSIYTNPNPTNNTSSFCGLDKINIDGKCVDLEEALNDAMNKDLTNVCHSHWGANSYYSEQSSNCLCSDGYVKTGGGCVTEDKACQLSFGEASYSSKPGICSCSKGYEFNEGKDTCIKKLVCEEGYIKKSGQCITHTQNCINYFNDENMVGKTKEGDDMESNCSCSEGYIWNVDEKLCKLKKDTSLPAEVIEVAESEIMVEARNLETIIDNIDKEAVFEYTNNQEEPKKKSFFSRFLTKIKGWFIK